MQNTTKLGLIGLTIFIAAFIYDSADAQIVRGARENVAGGVTAGGAHDVRGPFGGRSVGEGGVVTNGDGAGVSGSRGCARGGGGARGCGGGSTEWDGDGNVSHEHSGAAEGVFGNTAATDGSWDRDSNGDITGARGTEVNIGDRTYNIETDYNSGTGFDRDVSCSGSCN